MNGRGLVKQSYWRSLFSWLVDGLSSVADREEADFFSQNFLQELIEKARFPIYLSFPDVREDQRKRGLETINHEMEFLSRFELVTRRTDKLTMELVESMKEALFTAAGESYSDKLGNYLRSKIDMHIYGAPAFEMQFLGYKSGNSRLTIKRKETLLR